MGTKNAEFSQFARTSETGEPEPSQGDDEGRELTCDRFGRLWVRMADGGPSGPVTVTGAGSDFVNNVAATVVEPLASAAHALDRATLGGAVALTAKSSAGRLYQAYGVVDAPTVALWLQVHNTSGVPTAGAVPIATCPLTTCCGGDDNGNGGSGGPSVATSAPHVVATSAKLNFDVFGVYLDNGITLTVSTTGATFTRPTGTLQSALTALYK